MKTVTRTSRQIKWMAGAVAVLGTVVTMGGSLILAERYAQAGASRDASGYYAAGQIRRIGCFDKRNSRVAEVFRPSGAAA